MSERIHHGTPGPGNPTPPTGSPGLIPTGIQIFDRLYGGVERGDLLVLTADTMVHAQVLLGHVAAAVIQDGGHVALADFGGGSTSARLRSLIPKLQPGELHQHREPVPVEELIERTKAWVDQDSYLRALLLSSLQAVGGQEERKLRLLKNHARDARILVAVAAEPPRKARGGEVLAHFGAKGDDTDLLLYLEDGLPLFPSTNRLRVKKSRTIEISAKTVRLDEACGLIAY
jgi:hypothetical protein